jgi:outer membrane immunogenic protein
MKYNAAISAIIGLTLWAAPAAADGPNQWTGFYVGAHAGYGWGEWNGPLSYDDAYLTPEPFDNSNRTIEGDSAFGGLQVGVNYQSGSWVLGVEADVSWTDINGSGSFLPYPTNPASPAWDIETKLDMFGTVRGRLGYANGPLLVYATGGSVDRTHVGYAVGGGLEWMLARNWTLKAEYLFVDLGEEDYAYVGADHYDTDHYHPDLQLQTVRLGLNYKFD